MNETELRSSMEAHQRRNAELVAHLRTKDVDLRVPRLIELHFWADSHEGAVLLARALYEKGFLILVLAPVTSSEHPSRWNLEARVSQSVDVTVRPEFVEDLVRVANAFSAELDGWGTSV